MGELTVGTFNVRTLAYKEATPSATTPPSSTILQLCSDAGCDVIGLQETRRDGQDAITHGGYVVVWSGARAGTKDKKGVHGVGLAIKQSIVDGMEEGGMVVECISARLMKVRLQPNGKASGVSFVVGYAPTECTRDIAAKNSFWKAVDTAIREVPSGGHVVTMVDANARTGRRGDGCSDKKVLGAYGRDTLNDNGERLLSLAADNKLAVLNTFFSTPKRGISHTFQSANRGKGQYRLDYILIRQADMRLVRNVTVRRTDPKDSDHHLVYAAIRLLDRVAPNRRKINNNTSSGRATIDLQRLVEDSKLRKDFQAKIAPMMPCSTVDEMATALTDMVMSSAADVAPRAKCKGVPNGWCASKEVQHEIHLAWQ